MGKENDSSLGNLMTVKDYADKKEIPQSTVYNHIKLKKLKSKKIGSFIFVIDEED